MNFQQLAEHGTVPQVLPTMTGSHLTLPSDAQLRALVVAYFDGRVTRGGGPREAGMLTLKACGKRKLLKLTPYPGPAKFNWHYGELTNAGRVIVERWLAESA